MVDKELLKACVLNPCSVVPRMMLIDSMIETGWEEFKAMEAFEIPPTSQHLPSIYGGCGIGYGRGSGFGSGIGSGNGGGRGRGRGSSYGGRGGHGGGNSVSNGIGSGSSYDNNRGFLIMILEQQ